MAVIFDMDGTLIDSERIYLEMWKEVVDVNRYPGFMDLALRMVGIPAQDGKEIFCERYGSDFPYEKIWNDLDNLFCERYKTEPVPLKSGAKLSVFGLSSASGNMGGTGSGDIEIKSDAYKGVSGYEVTITNIYDTERFCLTVLKVWDDKNDRVCPGSQS